MASCAAACATLRSSAIRLAPKHRTGDAVHQCHRGLGSHARARQLSIVLNRQSGGLAVPGGDGSVIGAPGLQRFRAGGLVGGIHGSALSDYIVPQIGQFVNRLDDESLKVGGVGNVRRAD